MSNSASNDLTVVKTLINEGKFEEAFQLSRDIEHNQNLSQEEFLRNSVYRGFTYFFLGQFEDAMKIAEDIYQKSQELNLLLFSLDAIFIKELTVGFGLENPEEFYKAFELHEQLLDFNFLRTSFYNKSDAAVIIYSLEDNNFGKKSFNHIFDWYNDISKYCGEIPVVLFANKVDLVDQNNFDDSKIQKLVDKHNFLGFYRTSAKTGEGVNEAFNSIIKRLYNTYKHLS